MEVYKTVSKHLLYDDVIDGDGKIHREETFTGAFLTFLALCGAIAAVAAIVYLLQ